MWIPFKNSNWGTLDENEIENIGHAEGTTGIKDGIS
jgi:hypothetical protein